MIPRVIEYSKELEAVKRKKHEGRGEIVNRALYEELIMPKVMHEAHALDSEKEKVEYV